MKQIAVDCIFTLDGRVRVRRVHMNGRWQMVEQGRQWVDHLGRHVLVLTPGNQAQEIMLRPDTMTWVVLPSARAAYAV